MSDYTQGQSSLAQPAHVAAPAQEQPAGKRTLVDQLEPVQRHGSAGGAHGPDDAQVHAAADRGTATASSPLPHGDWIQRAFGRHDVSNVQAHTGRDAAASARDMGADAYASGNHVVLGNNTNDLFTVAHEAAHIVQQRGGVQLKGGVGAEGDAYERHADEVAHHVVQGKSAEGLLDRFAGSGGSPGGQTQRKINIGGQRGEGRKLVYVGGVELGTEHDVPTAWAEIIKVDPSIASLESQAVPVLTQWIVADKSYSDPSKVSEHRGYPSYVELARALRGEVEAQPALAHEGKLAATVLIGDSAANAAVGRFIVRLKGHVEKLIQAHSEKVRLDPSKADEVDTVAKVNKSSGRYAGWAYEPDQTYGTMFENIPATTLARVGFIADYSLSSRIALGTMAHFEMPDDMKKGRDTPHNTNENAPWVQGARQANVALSAGPSATTSNVMALAVTIGASQDELNGLAWGLFAIWNIMPMHKSGTHRFHEVMGVAKRYNVPYEQFQYPDAPPEADFAPPKTKS